MSFINISEQDAKDKYNAVKDDITVMRNDIPIAIEAKLRAHMLVSIFYEYAKYLLDHGHTFKETHDLVFKEIIAFKKDNKDYCPVNYAQTISNKIHELYLKDKSIGANIRKQFIQLAADDFKQHIPDPGIQQDCVSAQESFVDNHNLNYQTQVLTDVYFVECVNRIKKSCSPDIQFKTSLV